MRQKKRVTLFLPFFNYTESNKTKARLLLLLSNGVDPVRSSPKPLW